MSRPRKVEKPIDFSIRLDERLVKQLDEIAHAEKFRPSRNELIRSILTEYVERKHPKIAKRSKGD